MWVIYTIFFLMNLTKSLSYINKYLFNSIDPLKLRKILNEQLNLNYKYLPYNRAKSILHQEVDIIDIYGDNSLEKNVEHVFPQYYFTPFNISNAYFLKVFLTPEYNKIDLQFNNYIIHNSY